MKYTDALKIYNKNKDKWCFPRKGSVDYKKIRIIQGKPVGTSKKVDKNVIKKDDKVKKIIKNVVKKADKVKIDKNVKDIMKKISKKPKNISKKVFLKDVIKEESNTSNKNIKISKNLNKNSKAKKIQRFLRNKLISSKFTLDNRVKFSKYLQSRLKNIRLTDCLKTKIFKNGDRGYTINNIIDLVKKIGTESAYGVIYLSNIKDSLGGNSIVTKVMAATKDNLNEIKLMRKITDNILLKKKSKHFAAVHKHAICKNTNLINHKGENMPYPSKLKLVSINELAHGDLKNLIKDNAIISDENMLFNIMYQVFISIATFHNQVNYYHNDCHYGNILYQLNNDKGYYEYSICNKKYYLKACGHNMIIYDFGLSRNISDLSSDSANKKILADYLRILHAFLSKNNGWGSYYNLPSYECEKKVLAIKKHLENINIMIHNDRAGVLKLNSKKIFEQIVETSLIPMAPSGMFLTTKPKGTIINKEPFIVC
tara:strand:+ start:1033 stop:2478 length:1446 start_codon:yes stop_codon:yes gene_type:complete